MTREKAYLDTIKPYTNNYITFGDDSKGRIKGIGKLMYHGLPILDNMLDNMLLVERLTANVISISQLCDQ